MTDTQSDYPVLLFETQAQWREWLETHHATADGVWLQFYKKGQGDSIHYPEALDEALCFGWIDSQSKTRDEKSYIQKFTPRRKVSLWSKRNIEFVERLTRDGRMTPAGQAEVDRAKADGRWQQAYDKPSDMVVPQDFLDELAKTPKALEFFNTLNKANRYAIAWRLQTAKKPETREARKIKLLEMMRLGQKIH